MLTGRCKTVLINTIKGQVFAYSVLRIIRVQLRRAGRGGGGGGGGDSEHLIVE